MGILKNTISAGCLFINFAAIFAATNVTIDPVAGDVVYKQTFRLKADFTEADAYAIVGDWFKQSPTEFTRQNTDVQQKGNSSRNKIEVETAFDNSQPLQSLDPESKKIVVRGLTKYYGGFGSCINLLYIEYYAVFQIKDHELIATISQIKYHHYNRRTYTPQLIYSWQGGKPFDATDKFVTLATQHESSRDLNNLNSFINDDMTKLFVDIREVLKKKNLLANSRT